MNYELHYNKLIDRARARVLSPLIYTENHHILPRCMGGKDHPDNLVKLTGEEHLTAHLLLSKIYPDNPKLIYSAMIMSAMSNRHTGRSKNKQYGWLKRLAGQAHSSRLLGVERGCWWNNGVIQTISNECPGSDWVEGKLITDKKYWTDGSRNMLSLESPGEEWELGVTKETVRNLLWWNNGKKSQRAKECPGEDWVLGMANEPWNKGKKIGTCPHRKTNKGVPQPKKTDEARSKSGHKGTVWWTNGTNNKRSIVSPGEGWHKGTTTKSIGSTGMSWWNNGMISILAKECPLGYTKGRLKRG